MSCEQVLTRKRSCTRETAHLGQALKRHGKPHIGLTIFEYPIGADLHADRHQFCYCDRHQVKWCSGENVVSSWRNEKEEDWRRYHYKFSRYREVEPVNLWEALQ